MDLVKPDLINLFDYDKIIITVENESVARDMKNQLLELEVKEEKIEWIFESNDLVKKMYSVSEYSEDDARVNWVREFAQFVCDEGLEGCIAECGVNRGDFAWYMNKYFGNKKFYLIHLTAFLKRI